METRANHRRKYPPRLVLCRSGQVLPKPKARKPKRKK